MRASKQSHLPRQIFLTVIFLLVFACIPTVQYMQDESVTKANTPEPYVLNPKVAKAADLGLHNAASDLTWLLMIQYFGGRESATYEKLNDFLVLATELDPKFSYPYAFGTLVMPYFGKTDEAIALGKKGLENANPDWRIPYYLGTTYFTQRQDRTNAAKYFDIAANTPDAPENITKIAARFGTRPDQRSETRLIWEGIYDNSKDDVVKARAKNYLDHLDLLDLLDQAKMIYKRVYGKYPVELQDLVDARILKSIPVDPFGFQYKFDEAGTLQVK